MSLGYVEVLDCAGWCLKWTREVPPALLFLRTLDGIVGVPTREFIEQYLHKRACIYTCLLAEYGTCVHSCTRTSLSLSPSPPLSQSLSHSHPHSHSLSLSLILSLTHLLTPSVAPSLTHLLTLSLFLSLLKKRFLCPSDMCVLGTVYTWPLLGSLPSSMAALNIGASDITSCWNHILVRLYVQPCVANRSGKQN